MKSKIWIAPPSSSARTFSFLKILSKTSTMSKFVSAFENISSIDLIFSKEYSFEYIWPLVSSQESLTPDSINIMENI